MEHFNKSVVGVTRGRSFSCCFAWQQQNSLRKRGAVDNFAVGIFLACNFIKVESENLVRQVLNDRILSKIPQDPPPL